MCNLIQLHRSFPVPPLSAFRGQEGRATSHEDKNNPLKADGATGWKDPGPRSCCHHALSRPPETVGLAEPPSSGAPLAQQRDWKPTDPGDIPCPTLGSPGCGRSSVGQGRRGHTVDQWGGLRIRRRRSFPLARAEWRGRPSVVVAPCPQKRGRKDEQALALGATQTGASGRKRCP